MAFSSRTTAFVALLLAFNIVLLPLTANAACYVPKKPKPTPKPFIPRPAKCPIDTLKLGVCANVLNLVNVVVGTPPKTPCCALLQGLVDAEVALCLCTAIKANVLGINLNIPLSLSLLVNYCGKSMPSGFECS